MQFILDIQARVEASAAMHDERIAANDRQIAELTENSKRHDAAIAQLVDVTLSLAHRAEEADRRMEAGFNQVREIQVATEYRINALIDVVDKLARRNGDTPKP